MKINENAYIRNSFLSKIRYVLFWRAYVQRLNKWAYLLHRSHHPHHVGAPSHWRYLESDCVKKCYIIKGNFVAIFNLWQNRRKRLDFAQQMDLSEQTSTKSLLNRILSSISADVDNFRNKSTNYEICCTPTLQEIQWIVCVYVVGLQLRCAIDPMRRINAIQVDAENECVDKTNAGSK